jgi:5-methylcytosine-specific restriction protein B
MNYWHIQLHPDNRKDFSNKVIREILSEKKIIGLGEWEEGEKQREQFQNNMKIGDVVVVKSGKTPIAIVEVLGQSYYEENTNKNFDWFSFRRKIEILEFYKDEYQFDIPQPRGTLSVCDNLQAPTSKIIINWHKKAMKNKLLENVKLSEKRKEELKTLWENFITKYDSNEKKNIQKSLDEISNGWNTYRDKIINKTFSLDDYTNTLENETSGLSGGYLCNFLERKTSSVLGSSKPGNAINFGVKLNNDNETYTIGKNKPNATKEEAENYFKEVIKPLFSTIVSSKIASDKVELVEQSNYNAKQILRKLAVLDHFSDFIYIYSDSVINTLYDEIIESAEDTNLGRNIELQIVMQDILNLEKDNPVQRVILSRFLWLYSNSQGIADENTPNVILYGPPGTGKTYAVKNSLNFVCQGNRDRYEFVQFHPSFTYEDFIEGIKPKGVTKDGNIKFELVNGVFKRFCIKASKDPENKYYFVVDEINRANLSSVFGETLLCLEKDYRHNPKENNTDNLIKTQYSTLIEEMISDDEKNIEKAYYFDKVNKNVYFGVPNNVFFIGMMNDVDKSIDAFDLALRRRFKWIRKDCDYDVIEQETKFNNKDVFSNISSYIKSCKSLNNYISEELNLGKSYEFGHSFFMKVSGLANRKEIKKKNIEDLFNLHLRPTLKEYLRAMFAESELDNKLNEALNKFTYPITKG